MYVQHENGHYFIEFIDVTHHLEKERLVGIYPHLDVGYYTFTFIKLRDTGKDSDWELAKISAPDKEYIEKSFTDFYNSHSFVLVSKKNCWSKKIRISRIFIPLGGDYYMFVIPHTVHSSKYYDYYQATLQEMVEDYRNSWLTLHQKLWKKARQVDSLRGGNIPWHILIKEDNSMDEFILSSLNKEDE